MKKTPILVAVIGIAAAGGLAWWWQNQAAPGAAKSVAGGPGGAGAGGPSGAAPAAAGRPGGPAGPGGGPGGGPGTGPAAVEVAKAEAITLTDDISAVGSLRSRQGVMLRPEVSGRIARINFADGARVRRGQLLVQLDDTLQQAQLKQSEAQASIARTNLARSRELLGQGFVSQAAVDQNQAALEVAEAQVALARAQAARMKITAPFDGTAGLKLVDVGDYVRDGADIVNIEDLSALTVQFALPERTIERVRAGQPVELTLDALPGRSLKGRIVATESSVDANGRALQVLAQVENPGALLKPGMFARPRVVFETRAGAVVVPEEALVPLGARQLIFLVVDGPDGKPVSRRLEAKVGARLPGKVEILQGVKAGDTVVTAGHSRLARAESMPVRVIDLAKPPGPSGAAPGGGRTGGPAQGAAQGAPAPGGVAAPAAGGPAAPKP